MASLYIGHSKNSHVGYVQLICFRGRTMWFATFLNVSMASHVTAHDVRTCDSSKESSNNPVPVIHIVIICKEKRSY